MTATHANMPSDVTERVESIVDWTRTRGFSPSDVAELFRDFVGNDGVDEAEDGKDREAKKADVILRMRQLLKSAGPQAGEARAHVTAAGGDDASVKGKKEEEDEEGKEEGKEEEAAITADEEQLYEDIRSIITTFSSSALFSKIGSTISTMTSVVRASETSSDDVKRHIMDTASILGKDIVAETPALKEKAALSNVFGAAAGVMRALMKMICGYVPNVEMPVMSGLVDSAAGRVCYHLGNISFSQFSCDLDGVGASQAQTQSSSDSASAADLPPSGATADATDTYRTVHVKGVDCVIDNLMWSYGKVSAPYMMGRGSSRVEIKGLDITLKYNASVTGSGVDVTVEGSEIDIASVKVTMNDDSASWVYSLLLSVLNKRLSNAIKQSLASAIAVQVASRAPGLSTLSMGMFRVSVGADVVRMAREKKLDEWQSDVALHGSPFAINTAVPGKVYRLRDCLDAEFFMASAVAPKVILVSAVKSSNDDSQPPATLEAISKAYGLHFLVGWVPASSAKSAGLAHPIRARFQIERLPGVVIVPPPALSGTIDGECKQRHIVYRGDVSRASLMSYLANFQFILGKVALIPSVDALSIFMALQDNASLVVYIAGVADSADDDDEKTRLEDDDDACFLRAALDALAVEFGPGANPPARFAAVQASSDTDRRICREFLRVDPDSSSASILIVPPPVVENDEFYCSKLKQATRAVTPPPRGVRRDWENAEHMVLAQKGQAAMTFAIDHLRSMLASFESRPTKAVVSLSNANLDLFLSQKPKMRKMVMVTEADAETVDEIGTTINGSTSIDSTPHDGTPPTNIVSREALALAWTKHGQNCCIGHVSVARRSADDDSSIDTNADDDEGSAILDRLRLARADLPLLVALHSPSSEKLPSSRSSSRNGGKIGDIVVPGVGEQLGGNSPGTIALKVAPIVNDEPVEATTTVAAVLPNFHTAPSSPLSSASSGRRSPSSPPRSSSRKSSPRASPEAIALSNIICSFIADYCR